MWGTLPAGPPAAVAAPVHPHACGEHNRDIRDPETGNGSSPRMWGTHFDILSHLLSLRFIPTHVGNTDVMRPNFCEFRFIPTHVGNTIRFCAVCFGFSVHPHACGGTLRIDPETYQMERFIPTHVGGTLQPRQSTHRYSRFIPTHVGNTYTLKLISLLPPVHPHACGEHITTSVMIITVIGSSPRMWGTRAHDLRRLAAVRFIPTHVGNTPT